MGSRHLRGGRGAQAVPPPGCCLPPPGPRPTFFARCARPRTSTEVGRARSSSQMTRARRDSARRACVRLCTWRRRCQGGGGRGAGGGGAGDGGRGARRRSRGRRGSRWRAGHRRRVAAGGHRDAQILAASEGLRPCREEEKPRVARAVRVQPRLQQPPLRWHPPRPPRDRRRLGSRVARPHVAWQLARRGVPPPELGERLAARVLGEQERDGQVEGDGRRAVRAALRLDAHVVDLPRRGSSRLTDNLRVWSSIPDRHTSALRSSSSAELTR